MRGLRSVPSEADLWSRALNNDAIAFGQIFELHADRVFGYSLRRHRLALSKLPPRLDEPDPTSAVDRRLDAAANDVGVMAAFSSLSRHDQDVLALCVLEELSLAHAAHALGVPIGTVNRGFPVPRLASPEPLAKHPRRRMQC
jgi:hypothetical protein